MSWTHYNSYFFPKKLLLFFNFENWKGFTGSALRKTDAMLLANSDANVLQFKRLEVLVSSSTVVVSYVGDSMYLLQVVHKLHSTAN